MTEASARARWNATWRDGTAPREVSRFLLEAQPWLPTRGRALDVAGGPGVEACWLAARGLSVTLVDVSDVALERAQALATSRGLTLDVLQRDLEAEGPPPGPWDVIVCLNYLQPSLFALWPTWLAPGGVVLFAQPTTRNLERHAKPSARFLVPLGAARAWLPPSLEVLAYSEDWTEAGRHEVHLVARRPSGEASPSAPK